MIKELGPVLTGLMLAGRIGSGIAAELGSMVAQINCGAGEPTRCGKLVVPRVLAGVFMALVPRTWHRGHRRRWLIAVFQLRVASSLYWTSVVDGLPRMRGWD